MVHMSRLNIWSRVIHEPRVAKKREREKSVCVREREARVCRLGGTYHII